MSFWFRKSFKFGPGRISLSKSGPSLSGGTKGARLTLGARGLNLMAGAKGIFYRKHLGGATNSPRDAGANPQMSTMAAVAIWFVILAAGAGIVACVGFVVWMLR
ncbi:MAG TPA: DUF4236 domain-containing protein [Terriglobia bacterium]|nr:DUF4236 domain-containing protein [Terriglobia bacterium]